MNFRICGLGRVGSGLFKLFTESGAVIASRQGVAPSLRQALHDIRKMFKMSEAAG